MRKYRMKLTNNYKSFKLCKKSNDSYVMLYSPIIFIEVLCVVNIIYVIINVCNGTIDFSSVLCSDLMSLVGMAISVWTGISIFNAIENSKMVALDKKAQEAQESVDKLNKRIDEFLEQNANTYRLQFETELSINKDKIAEFIFSKISDTDIPLDSKPNIYYNMFIQTQSSVTLYCSICCLTFRTGYLQKDVLLPELMNCIYFLTI